MNTEFRSAEEVLHDVSDEEWRSAHEALIESGAIPADEAEYVWAPGVPADRFDDRPRVDYEGNSDSGW